MNKEIDQFDIDAENEGKAINKSFRNKTDGFGKQLRRTYKIDGETFSTGEKHRRINRSH